MRGRHELDIHLDGREMAVVGQGAVQREEINLQSYLCSHITIHRMEVFHLSLMEALRFTRANDCLSLFLAIQFFYEKKTISG